MTSVHTDKQNGQESATAVVTFAQLETRHNVAQVVTNNDVDYFFFLAPEDTQGEMVMSSTAACKESVLATMGVLFSARSHA